MEKKPSHSRRYLYHKACGENARPSEFFIWHRQMWLDYMRETGEIPIGHSHDEKFNEWLERQVLGGKEKDN